MSTNDRARPDGIILLSQPQQIGITWKEMTQALPETYRSLPLQAVEIDIADTVQQAIREQDWSAAQRALEEQFKAKFAPVREKHPDWPVIYFGSSPVPLAIHLGLLLETWQAIEVIPHDHEQRAWGWVLETARPAPRLAPVDLPDFKDRTPGEAIIRVSTSHQVDPLLTRDALAEPPLVEIDISLEQPAEDAFSSVEQMQEVAGAFRKALDRIGDNFPGVHRVHLFASVQPGMALLLGVQISKTMHPPVQTYQYTRNADGGPFHMRALLINGPSRAVPLPPSSEEQALAERDRTQLAADVDRMKGFAHREKSSPSATWIQSVLPGAEGGAALFVGWHHLPDLRRTPLPRTRVDLAARSVADSFRLYDEAWQLDDRWLARLARRLPEDARRHRGLRLLVLHEAVHRGPQGLTSTVSRGIGRFPKVVEEIDYHADVWAMLYEHALQGFQAPVSDLRRFFMDLALIATETMWAFDDDGELLREVQIRRLNRYLIWYWQYLLLERGALDGNELSLEDVLEIMAQRPTIELAGPPVFTRDERVFFRLDDARRTTPELCVYYQGRLYRHGQRFDFSLDALLDGVRERNGTRIIEELRAAVEQTVR